MGKLFKCVNLGLEIEHFFLVLIERDSGLVGLVDVCGLFVEFVEWEKMVGSEVRCWLWAGLEFVNKAFEGFELSLFGEGLLFGGEFEIGEFMHEVCDLVLKQVNIIVVGILEFAVLVGFEMG